MDSNARKYLEYLREPTSGLMELYNIAKNHLLDDIEENLDNGIYDSRIYDGLHQFYLKTSLYDFNGMHYELSSLFLDKILKFERAISIQIDKEKIYFLQSLFQISSSNTVGAMASWELATKERIRTTGLPITTTDLIASLPTHTIINPIEYGYSSNPFTVSVISKYSFLKPTFKEVISQLSGLDAISFLSSGLRNLQVAGLIGAHNNSLELNRIFAQEIINNLCILNESIIKDYPEVATTILLKKKRQIGKMLSPATLGLINLNVSNILGDSTGGYSGLYLTLQLFDEVQFNIQYPTYLNNLMTSSLTVDEFKAHVLLGIHALRNKVLHDYDDTLCYYSSSDLFLKTIGLLFIGVSVTKNLR